MPCDKQNNIEKILYANRPPTSTIAANTTGGILSFFFFFFIKYITPARPFSQMGFDQG